MVTIFPSKVLREMCLIEEVQSTISGIYRRYPKDIIFKAILSLNNPRRNKMKKIKTAKLEKVMKEFKEGKLHSGSKEGPKVKNKKQAIAIALSEAKKTVKKPVKKK